MWAVHHWCCARDLNSQHRHGRTTVLENDTWSCSSSWVTCLSLLLLQKAKFTSFTVRQRKMWPLEGNGPTPKHIEIKDEISMWSFNFLSFSFFSPSQSAQEIRVKFLEWTKYINEGDYQRLPSLFQFVVICNGVLGFHTWTWLTLNRVFPIVAPVLFLACDVAQLYISSPHKVLWVEIANIYDPS